VRYLRSAKFEVALASTHQARRIARPTPPHTTS
jgi:hypothetical protein